MKSKFTDLLKPEIIHSMAGLELIAKVVTEEVLHGLNNSNSLGVGGDFNQYRSYQPGDDARQIDWKVYGRSERYYTKLTERETHVKVKFLIDLSESMLHQESGISKLDYAKVLTASLGFLTYRQGDALGLYGMSDDLIVHPVKSYPQYNHFLFQLSELQASGKWINNPYSINQIYNPKEKELIVLITDLHQYDKEIYKAIKHLKTQRNEIVVLLISGQDERNFNYSGTVVFEELESHKTVKIDVKEVKSIYLDKYAEQLTDINKELLQLGVDMQEFVMGEDMSQAIQLFLTKRKTIR